MMESFRYIVTLCLIFSIGFSHSSRSVYRLTPTKDALFREVRKQHEFKRSLISDETVKSVKDKYYEYLRQKDTNEVTN